MTSIAKPDYWSILGLEPGSDKASLKIAFRREARKWHPDLNINDIHAEERFKLINEAYAVLSDPRKRSIWEEQEDCQRDDSNSFEQGFPDFEEYIASVLGIEEIIENEPDEYINKSKTKQWPATSPPQPPPVRIQEDIETYLDLTPDQALLGSQVELELADGTVVEVRTPKMAGDGWRLRLAGVASGGRDHFLQLRVRTDDGLRIDGLRVLYRLELFPPDAVLGCAVDVPTLAGPVTLQVPPRSSSGRLLRLRGRGMELEGAKGDQLVEIIVVIPAELGDAERALYGRLQELSLDPDAI